MIELITAAFTMGLLGSFHCIGMCGPLALSLPVNKEGEWQKFVGTFLYNAGRVVTYGVFGLLFGTIGKSLALLGGQQLLSIVFGVIILLSVLLHKCINVLNRNNNVLRLFAVLRTWLAK